MYRQGVALVVHADWAEVGSIHCLGVCMRLGVPGQLGSLHKVRPSSLMAWGTVCCGTVCCGTVCCLLIGLYSHVVWAG